MKKDIEWLKEEIKDGEVDLKYAFDNYVPYEKVLIADDVNKLLNQLEEPEQTDIGVGLSKPVIPQFVVDFIRETKPNNSLRLAFEYIAQQKIDNYDDELALWIEEGNSELFARAWIDGYKVEEEKVYHVVNKKNYFMLRKYDGLVDIFHVSPSMSRDEYGKDTRFMLTEKEIKDYDERYWAFAQEVTE